MIDEWVYGWMDGCGFGSSARSHVTRLNWNERPFGGRLQRAEVMMEMDKGRGGWQSADRVEANGPEDARKRGECRDLIDLDNSPVGPCGLSSESHSLA